MCFSSVDQFSWSALRQNEVCLRRNLRIREGPKPACCVVIEDVVARRNTAPDLAACAGHNCNAVLRCAVSIQHAQINSKWIQ